jgi:hypothetical protein
VATPVNFHPRADADALAARRFPFHLVYVEEPAGVPVVAVAHDRRRPGYWRRRLP